MKNHERNALPVKVLAMLVIFAAIEMSPVQQKVRRAFGDALTGIFTREDVIHRKLKFNNALCVTNHEEVRLGIGLNH